MFLVCKTDYMMASPSRWSLLIKWNIVCAWSLEKRLSSMVELLKKTICIKFTSLIWMQLVSPSKIFLSLVQTSCWVLIVYSQRNKNICIYILDTFLFNYASVYNNIYPFFLVFGKEEGLGFKDTSCSCGICCGILSYKYLQEFLPMKSGKVILKEGFKLYPDTRIS